MIFEYYHLLFICLIDGISSFISMHLREKQLKMSHLMCVHGPLMEVEDEDCADHAACNHNLGWLVVQLLYHL